MQKECIIAQDYYLSTTFTWEIEIYVRFTYSHWIRYINMKSNLFALAATIILLELEPLSALPGAELEVADEVSETTSGLL